MLGIGGFTTAAPPSGRSSAVGANPPAITTKFGHKRRATPIEAPVSMEPAALAVLLALALPAALPPRAAPGGLSLDLASLASVAALGRLPAACAADMTLVDGEFCPALDYQCDRFVDPAAPSCAEYAQKPQCRYNTSSRRFCVDRHEWPNRAGARPKVFVTWYEAQELCQSAGKRLCRRSEWTLACEGPKRAPYPYGWERLPSPCNLSRAVLPVRAEDLIDPRKRE